MFRRFTTWHSGGMTYLLLATPLETRPAELSSKGIYKAPAAQARPEINSIPLLG